MKPAVMVLKAAGTNCEAETVHAWRLAGAEAEVVHLRRLLACPALLRDYAALTIPGGFSYGDDIAAGTILAQELRHGVGDELWHFVEDGGLVLGICNGFQVLLKLGLLPDPRVSERRVTLAPNRQGRFVSRWVRLRSGAQPGCFLCPNATLELPIAHAEGRFICTDERALHELEDRGQIALRYVEDEPAEGAAEGAAEGGRFLRGNPNGSMGAVAGLTDPSGRILGLMPHPERFVDPTQHPWWTRGPTDGIERASCSRGPVSDGLALFQVAVAACGR